jgi:hypothetical protein
MPIPQNNQNHPAIMQRQKKNRAQIADKPRFSGISTDRDHQEF